MGEAKQRLANLQKRQLAAIGVDTPGGRVQVRWDAQAAVTPLGQMAFFIEFLHLTGLWANWVEDCPLHTSSPNAPSKQTLLGTWLLSILAGHRRYAHVTALRCDGVNPALLGMPKVLSEDALRRGLQRIEEKAGVRWLDAQLRASVLPLLSRAWIMDVDTTIKPLYGRQEGAVLGYNPQKPGRPSHAYHSYLVAGLRLVLGVEVEAGNRNHAEYALPGLLQLLDGLPVEQRPYLVRGDIAFGTQRVLGALEERQQAYLSKLRLSKNVKHHVERCFAQGSWQDAGQGWEGCDGQLRLSGWSRARRVVLLRRALSGDIALKPAAGKQLELAFVLPHGPGKRYEYAVLVSSLPHAINALAQLYRDRGDAENNFDELKNQWAWTGFTTHDLHRCQLAARAVALVYNWWSLFVRLAIPQERREAITSRPLLLSALAQRTEHAGQTRLTITAVHAFRESVAIALARISAGLQRIKRLAEQLATVTPWQIVCDMLAAAITGLPPRFGLKLQDFSSA